MHHFQYIIDYTPTFKEVT